MISTLRLTHKETHMSASYRRLGSMPRALSQFAQYEDTLGSDCGGGLRSMVFACGCTGSVYHIIDIAATYATLVSKYARKSMPLVSWGMGCWPLQLR